MTKKTYESYRKDYFQAIFDTEYPERERIEAALDRAHEIRQFEISLYWQRSLFFWGFVLTLFGVLGLMLTAEKKTSLTDFMPVIIAALGFFTTCAWYYVEKGSKAWMANWELHIDYLEDDITGKLHKTTLWLNGKQDNFFSASKITQTVIFAFGLFWLLASVVTTLNAFLPKKLECFFCFISKSLETCPWLSIALPTLIFIIVCFLACCKKCCFSDCCKKCCSSDCCKKCCSSDRCKKCCSSDRCKKCCSSDRCKKCCSSDRCKKCCSSDRCKKCYSSDRCKKFLTCLKKRGLGHWRTGDNKKFSDEDKPSDKETVWFSQRERKLKEAKKLTCL